MLVELFDNCSIKIRLRLSSIIIIVFVNSAIMRNGIIAAITTLSNKRKDEGVIMIEIDIPSIDPMQHEPKIFFGMTSRQCLCIVPGVIVGAALFMLAYKKNLDIAVISLCAAVVPAALFGWYAPYNMKFEQFIKLWWFNTFVANPKRIYKTDNAEFVKQLTLKERQELEKKQKKSDLANKKKKPIKKENDGEGL